MPIDIPVLRSGVGPPAAATSRTGAARPRWARPSWRSSPGTPRLPDRRPTIDRGEGSEVHVDGDPVQLDRLFDRFGTDREHARLQRDADEERVGGGGVAEQPVGDRTGIDETVEFEPGPIAGPAPPVRRDPDRRFRDARPSPRSASRSTRRSGPYAPDRPPAAIVSVAEASRSNPRITSAPRSPIRFEGGGPPRRNRRSPVT